MKNTLFLPLLIAAGNLAVGAIFIAPPATLPATFRAAPTTDTLTVRGRITDFSNQQAMVGATVLVKSTTVATATDGNGHYKIRLPKGHRTLVFSLVGYDTQERKVTGRQLSVALKPSVHQLNEVVVSGTAPAQKRQEVAYSISSIDVTADHPSEVKGEAAPARKSISPASGWSGNGYVAVPRSVPGAGETYAHTQEGGFHQTTKDLLSTFSIDVDAASYANVRRFLNQGQLPPPDAVRIEEMLNYFQYDYPQPTGPEPFSVTTELAACPWNPTHQLVHVGLQGRTVATDKLPPANLVFLVDVSGSMNSDDKLPLVQAGLRLLVKELRPQDKVALVVYAGAAGLVLPPTAGDKRSEILRAIDNLRAGGSTAGGAGLRLAYQVARDNFRKEGNNRVILATDGDFNVGEQSDDAMEHLIVQERESGVFLTVLGVGQGNYQDKKMELLADKGNGNYAYLDNLDEARRVLVRQFGGTLFTLAKDVKLQVEFNPARVREYRLIGYENRTLAAEDFNNDRKDAGEMGAGHTVTALYEVVPVGAPAAVD